ncbi:polyketide cyclase [Amycolatopsis alkalitolerans]|uniref:Polyketide cyclase n=2 Tax=Amycolatopsis alkalitolerans TaxID=2547244 RepID=A0A5C4LSP5_9PSEU|nr:polyketide cyclase [Amycolatopsis alkalitolerans]
MEFGSIEQSVFVDASPAVVYEVVSSPEHIAGWYVDEAEYETVSGSRGHFAFGAPERRVEVPITVVEAVPGVKFSFRWMAPPAPEIPPVGATLTPENSLLVTFDLAPQGDGTLLTVTEAGMRELGWDAALLENYYNDHSEGWISLLGRLEKYVGQRTAGRP